MSKIKKLAFVLLFVPGAIGVFGYISCGIPFYDAIYMAIKMYLFDAEVHSENIVIEIARWLSPLATVSGIIIIIRSALSKIVDFFIEFRNDAVAVYGDNELKKIAIKNIRYAVSGEENDVDDVQSHIILFSSENEGLAFYKAHKEKFKGEVFIKIDKNDSYSVSLPGVKFFNPYEIIARKFWQTYDIRQVIRDDEMTIAIVGSDVLARKILKYGLLNNLYSLTQRIRYEIWSDDAIFESIHCDFKTMNADTVVYKDNKSPTRFMEIAAADRIIITDNVDSEILAEIAAMTAGKIYVFDPMDTYVDVFNSKMVYPFGQYSDMLTKENIRTDSLYSFAKELNYHYTLMYSDKNSAEQPTADEAWDMLDTFTKGSNIASADYHDIRLIVMKETEKTDVDDELAEIEHIRWCRYHYLNHWKYGETHDGKKNAKNRIHPCLVPFNELCDINKGKDADGVSTLLSLRGI